MVDMARAAQEQGAWFDSMIPTYEDGMISIISVNCTTLNMEFNPNDP
jgi:hypothetical protein